VLLQRGPQRCPDEGALAGESYDETYLSAALRLDAADVSEPASDVVDRQATSGRRRGRANHQIGDVEEDVLRDAKPPHGQPIVGTDDEDVVSTVMLHGSRA
jgi:hypothetical protein